MGKEYCCEHDEYRCSLCKGCYNHDHEKFFETMEDGSLRYYYRCNSTGQVKPAYPDYYPRGFVN